MRSQRWLGPYHQREDLTKEGIDLNRLAVLPPHAIKQAKSLGSKEPGAFLRSGLTGGGDFIIPSD